LKFSYKWISELVGGLSVEPAELQRLITMKTAECEGIEAFGAYFEQVIAVRVLDVQPVGKGKNKLVAIDAGDHANRSVVCGAPNVRPGLLAAWVPPGTTLGEKTIGTAVIDGAESEGMLASAAELGLGRDHSGVLELSASSPGDKLSGVSPDWTIEIDNKSLTHRPDLWGHLGMAREVSAIAGLSLHDPVQLSVLPQGGPKIKVDIANLTLAPRYSALVLEGIEVGPSPLWLQARLQAIGLNPISNIVDITNYVLAELPQPMHAFDADKVVGRTIFVRNAREGEQLAALNGETYDLHAADLVIADASGPIALAGVIGGAGSAISETTKRVVLESANFQAASVRLTSSRHKLRTDASVRFEKSLDPENTLRGLARAYELIRQVNPSVKAAGGVADTRGPLAAVAPVLLPVAFVSRKLGVEVEPAFVIRILHSLGFQVAEIAAGMLTVTVPSWRATKDISHKDDLVEEIGRMIGYDQITPQAPAVAAVVPPENPLRPYLRAVRQELVAQGFTEVYNYSFVSEDEAKRFGYDASDLVAVANPIASDLTHLRPSLLPGIFKNILSNVRHFREFRLFEIGNEICPNASTEATHAVAAMYNANADERDFFELKRVLECVLPSCRLRAVQSRSFEHPTRTAEIIWHDAIVGRMFELHPSFLEEEGLEGRAMLFDVDLQQTQEIAGKLAFRYHPPRKYPTSGFDLSVVADCKIPVADIQEGLLALAGSDLAVMEFVRQYDGPPLHTGQKSVTYHLEIGSLDHTVTAEEVAVVRSRIVEGMRAKGFEFRI
jgi:phenylalanyl-tRNA synthetase beta chain